MPRLRCILSATVTIVSTILTVGALAAWVASYMDSVPYARHTQTCVGTEPAQIHLFTLHAYAGLLIAGDHGLTIAGDASDYRPGLAAGTTDYGNVLPVARNASRWRPDSYVLSGMIRLGAGTAESRVVSIPLWQLALICAVWPTWHLTRTNRRWRAARPGLCPKCGYDLRASPERCPECGAAVVGP